MTDIRLVFLLTTFLVSCGNDEPQDDVRLDVCDAYVAHLVACNALGGDSDSPSAEEIRSDCRVDLSVGSYSCRRAKANVSECRGTLECSEILQGLDCDAELENASVQCKDQS